MNLRELAHSQKSSEWGTPKYYIDLVKEVFGGVIELDPASSHAFNQTVGAQRIFTIDDDGLSKPWNARSVFLNAPGGPKGKSGQTIWGDKLYEEYLLGNTQEAIQLIFRVGTETEFFQTRLGKYPICLVDHRIKFIPMTGMYEDTSKNQPTHGNAFLYMGPNEERFTHRFSRIGKVIPAWQKAT